MSSNTLTVQVTFVELCLKAERPNSNTDRGAPPAVTGPEYTARPGIRASARGSPAAPTWASIRPGIHRLPQTRAGHLID
jgi:hypothetical protein